MRQPHVEEKSQRIAKIRVTEKINVTNKYDLHLFGKKGSETGHVPWLPHPAFKAILIVFVPAKTKPQKSSSSHHIRKTLPTGHK